MKKCGTYILILTVFFNIFSPIKVAFAEAAYNSFTISVDGEIIETQTAYEAVGFLSLPELSRPEDLFIDSRDWLFVADSALGHIVILNEQRNLIGLVGEEVLNRPTGVAVNAEGEIFVADTNSVFKFSENGELLREFTRPETPLFGRTQPFSPRKIALDARGNMHIAGEAASNGLISLNADGEFLGYFGANQTTLSLFQALQNFLMSMTNFTRQFMNVPLPPTNLAINERGVILTITSGLESEAIKMLNIAGTNMLDSEINAPLNGVDIAIGNQGNFYALFADGTIAEYDASGNVLFFFGASDPSTQRLGVFRQPTSIAVTADGSLYVSDAETGLITYLIPTEFTQKVHRGLAYFEEGLYVQSEDYWQEVLRSNSSFGLAHQAIGQSQFKQMEYEDALVRFRLANDRSGYSDAFWEIRNLWLQEHTATILTSLIVVYILWQLVKRLDKKTEAFSGIKGKYTRLKNRRFIRELAMAKKVLRHPLDTFYEVRRENKGSVKTAAVLYFLLFIVFFFTLYFPGFIFSTSLVEDLGLILLATIFIVVLGLFIVINYLVSTINEGEGSLSKVFIGTAYAFSPFILFGIPITVVSRIITLNEAFFYHFALQIVISWSLLLLFLMIKEVHDFEFGKTVKNSVLTIFGSMVTILVVFIFYILLNQVYQFIYSLAREVLIRV